MVLKKSFRKRTNIYSSKEINYNKKKYSYNGKF